MGAAQIFRKVQSTRQAREASAVGTLTVVDEHLRSHNSASVFQLDSSELQGANHVRTSPIAFEHVLLTGDLGVIEDASEEF
jgi:hypothetical protein